MGSVPFIHIQKYRYIHAFKNKDTAFDLGCFPLFAEMPSKLASCLQLSQHIRARGG
jgi:hypothetical protein